MGSKKEAQGRLVVAFSFLKTLVLQKFTVFASHISHVRALVDCNQNHEVLQVVWMLTPWTDATRESSWEFWVLHDEFIPNPLSLAVISLMSRIQANSKEGTGILKENHQEKLTPPEMMEGGFEVYPLKWKDGPHLAERLSCP